MHHQQKVGRPRAALGTMHAVTWAQQPHARGVPVNAHMVTSTVGVSQGVTKLLRPPPGQLGLAVGVWRWPGLAHGDRHELRSGKQLQEVGGLLQLSPNPPCSPAGDWLKSLLQLWGLSQPCPHKGPAPSSKLSTFCPLKTHGRCCLQPGFAGEQEEAERRVGSVGTATCGVSSAAAPALGAKPDSQAQALGGHEAPVPLG